MEESPPPHSFITRWLVVMLLRRSYLLGGVLATRATSVLDLQSDCVVLRWNKYLLPVYEVQLPVKCWFAMW